MRDSACSVSLTVGKAHWGIILGLFYKSVNWPTYGAGRPVQFDGRKTFQEARYALCWYGTCKMQLHNDHTQYKSHVQTFTASKYPDQIKPTNLCRCPQMQRLRSVFWRHGNISKFNFDVKSIKLPYLKTAINWNEMEQFLINFWI